MRRYMFALVPAVTVGGFETRFFAKTARKIIIRIKIN